MLNCLLITFLQDNYKIKRFQIVSVFVIQALMWIFIKFDLTDMSYHAWIAMIIAIVFSLGLGPIFMYLLDAIVTESMNFVKISFKMQNQFKWMLDSM